VIAVDGDHPDAAAAVGAGDRGAGEGDRPVSGARRDQRGQAVVVDGQRRGGELVARQ